jgi:hypothetical protein
MSERILLLQRIKGRPWKLVHEFTNLDVACMRCDAMNALTRSRPYRVAIQEVESEVAVSSPSKGGAGE